VTLLKRSVAVEIDCEAIRVVSGEGFLAPADVSGIDSRLPLSQHVLSAGYASGLALIFLSGRRRPFLNRFAAVGRMALTDSLMQSVVCTLVLLQLHTGVYGRVCPAMGLLRTVILFAAQVEFGNWWVAHYRFGPWNGYGVE
jgi:uncharacterized membrane protein YeiB